MIFEFDQALKAQQSLEIGNIGDFAIEASNDEGFYYYLLVKTTLGSSTIITYGPIVPDINLLPSGFSTTLERIPYKEPKIIGKINYFLNDKKKITKAKEVLFEEALDAFIDIKAYLESCDSDMGY